jgi:hypothetical protein
MKKPIKVSDAKGEHLPLAWCVATPKDRDGSSVAPVFAEVTTGAKSRLMEKKTGKYLKLYSLRPVFGGVNYG